MGGGESRRRGRDMGQTVQKSRGYEFGCAMFFSRDGRKTGGRGFGETLISQVVAYMVNGSSFT